MSEVFYSNSSDLRVRFFSLLENFMCSTLNIAYPYATKSKSEFSECFPAATFCKMYCNMT